MSTLSFIVIVVMAIVNQGTSQSYEFCDDGKGEMARGNFSTCEKIKKTADRNFSFPFHLNFRC